LFKDPEDGELCQVGGWGRVTKEDTFRKVIQTHELEVCVPIVNISECRNNYIVNNAGVEKLSEFKQHVEEQIDWVYDGMHICAGSNSKDACMVRFIVLLMLNCAYIFIFLFLTKQLLLDPRICYCK
jgi:hypothetical protein